MDTRSKKFDRSLISKTIAFLLAIIAFAMGTFSVLECGSKTFELGRRSVVWEDYLRESLLSSTDFKVEESRGYHQLYANAVCGAVIGFGVFGDGSEKAYNKYQAERKAYFDTRDDVVAKRIIDNCLGSTGRGDPVAILNYIYNTASNAPFVSLKKIGEHKKHYINGSIAVYENGPVEFNDRDSGASYEYGYYFGEEDVTAPDSIYQTTQVYERYDEDIRENEIFINRESPNEIPYDMASEAGKDEYVVELCHCRVEPQIFDGYYLLTLNRENIKASGNIPIKYRQTFNSYSDFFNEYEQYRKDLLALKNLKIAVVDNKTGFISSNVEALDGTKKTDKIAGWFKNDKLSEYRFADFSKKEQRNPEHEDVSFIITDYGVTEDDLYGEFDCTLYTAFDSSLKSGEDAFSYIKSDYVIADEAFQKALKICLVCLGIILLCIVYLVIRSGRKSGDDELHMMSADRIFTLLRTAINAGLIFGVGTLGVIIIGEIIYERSQSVLLLSGAGILAAVAMAFLIDWILYIARHIKNHSLIKNLFIVWLVIKLKKLIKKEEELRKARPVIYQDIMNDVLKRVLIMGFLPNLVIGILITILLGMELFGSGLFFIFVLFAYDIFLAFYICRYAYSAREVIHAVNQIRNGNNNIMINTDKMPQAVKSFANDVMTLNEGLKIAVANAVKEQRMKTELITNVSHDLKTPLTSIINYVDLLSRCDIENETALGYIDVLGEKSARLKKLIEDLVEASKASSGAMRVELVSVSLNELSAQVAGEYEEEFEKKNLELVCESDSENIIVRADSKLSYRILDNLMGNIKKYAMPGTRVYLTLSKTESGGVLTLRNISQNKLNIPVSELLERFVRADESRSTEGSGLGLSIADNLCSLQGAQLELEINGDLFTARVTFPLC